MSDETTTPEVTPDAPATPKLKFGFAILVSEDGDVFIERTKDVLAIEVEREATLLEVRRYTSEILMDLQAQSAAEYVGLRMASFMPPAPTEAPSA
jgi:hypothetical protein